MPDALERRREVAVAGHKGDTDLARSYIGDTDASVRASALRALWRCGELSNAELKAALGDGDPVVRTAALELAAVGGGLNVTDVLTCLEDADAGVVEAAAWCLGEFSGAEAVEALSGVALEHEDALCRESAVAALGAIGHPDGLAAVLAATQDKPAVRRRAVISLVAFEGPEVDQALERALQDPDKQVRQAAEELLS